MTERFHHQTHRTTIAMTCACSIEGSKTPDGNSQFTSDNAHDR